MPLDFPPGVLEDRNGDGVLDYIRAKIYVEAHPQPEDLAAAANVAARLAFAVESLDLPLGFPLTAYDPADASTAIVVGRAAAGFDPSVPGSGRPVLRFETAADAERWALTVGAESPRATGAGPETPHPSSTPAFSLSTLFSVHGLFRSAGGLLPDRTATQIHVGPEPLPAVIDLAARIALETTGLELPLVRVADDAVPGPNAILIGRSNPWVRRLIEAGKFHPDLGAGQGRLEIVADAFAPGAAVLVIAGRDPEGEAAAIAHAAERLPYVWSYGPDGLHLEAVETEVRRFFARRSPAGQIAAAWPAARGLLAAAGAGRGNARLDFHFERVPAPVLRALEKDLAPHGHVRAVNLDVESAGLIFEQTFDLPWEVDEARARFAARVLPAVQPGSSVDVELRLSEPVAVRRGLAAELTRALLAKGAAPGRTQVRVLSAHKQGYGWIDEIVKPELNSAASIEIAFRELEPSPAQKTESRTRWLRELFPIDAVLARDLGLDPDAVTFRRAAAGPTYQVRARDAADRIVHEAGFDPRWIPRPLFDAYPDYAEVITTTGWIAADIDGASVIDERIVTDPERFWDALQAEAYPRLRDYLLGLYGPAGPPDRGPFFGRFEVDVELSEPDHAIGVDQERISTVEALHEDVYFETLLFLEVLGEAQWGRRLTYPGRIIPRIRAAERPGPPRASVRLTGKERPSPGIELRVREPEGEERSWSLSFEQVLLETPRMLGAIVQADHEGVVRADVALRVDPNASPGLTADAAREMLATLAELRPRGIEPGGMAWEALGRLRVTIVESGMEQGAVTLPPPAADFLRGERIETSGDGTDEAIDWTRPMDSAAAQRALTRLARFPEVRPFLLARSYLGKPVWAAEVTTPPPGRFFSRAKAIATKPVLMITGRQHGNEVSSTSHILKLAERLATDPDHRRLLDRAHLVIHPLTNPDGADLAAELAARTPDFMLHAGYLGCLGADVATGQWDADPVYPESAARPRLWASWLPDVVLDPHGYPSHEWVQLFAGYAAWVRSTDVVRREWWTPRGCFMPSFQHLDAPDHPQHRALAFALRDRIAAALNAAAGDVSRRMYARHRKYAGWEPEPGRREEICHGILVSMPEEASKPDPDARSFMLRRPDVTAYEGVIELPDETAHGAWLETLTNAGLAASMAALSVLAESRCVIRREREERAGGVLLTLERVRPIDPRPNNSGTETEPGVRSPSPNYSPEPAA